MGSFKYSLEIERPLARVSNEIRNKPCGDNGSLVRGGSEPRAASDEESNLFCACHLLNCDEGQADFGFSTIVLTCVVCNEHLAQV
jgi:hypothetical protein